MITQSRYGSPSPPLHTHTAAPASTHAHNTPSPTDLALQIAHTCSWLLAACHPPPALTLFPQHRKPSRQASGAVRRGSGERARARISSPPVWTEPAKFTVGNSGVQKQQRWPAPHRSRQSTSSTSRALERVTGQILDDRHMAR